MSTCARLLRLALLCAGVLATAACGGPQVRVSKTSLAEGTDATVTARVAGAPNGTPVAFTIADGRECGHLPANPATVNTTDGVATVTYTAEKNVEDCKATIKATALERSGSAALYVNKLPLTKARIDGVSMLALFAIASFAIDRLVRTALALLALFGWWRRLIPQGSDPTSQTWQRIAYVALACVPAVLVLGWFGKIRMLSALGFAQTNDWVDILFTGLLLVGGADRVEPLLEKMGAGSSAAGAASSAKPIEITGRLVLEDSQKKEPSAGPYSFTS